MQEVAKRALLLRAGGGSRSRTQQPAKRKLSDGVGIAAVVARVASHNDAGLARFCCPARLFSLRRQKRSQPSSSSRVNQGLLLKPPGAVKKAGRVETHLNNRSYGQALRVIAKARVRNWPLDLDQCGIGPGSEGIRPRQLAMAPQTHDLERQATPAVGQLSAWASQFWARWAIERQA